MVITIKDGREKLWQWDTGRRLFVTEVSNVTRLDFVQDRQLCVSVKNKNADGSWNVPNILLTKSGDIEVIVVYLDSDGYESIVKGKVEVQERPKPSDYIYTETEVQTWRDVLVKVQEIVDGVNKVNVKVRRAKHGVVVTATDRNGVTESVTVYDGETYDDTRVKELIQNAFEGIADVDASVVALAGEVETLQEVKMQRVVLYLSQSGSAWVLKDSAGVGVAFDRLYGLVKDETNYVVVLMGNSKLRPQYVSVNEIRCDGEDRDSQGTIFLRMIMTPSSLYYGTFRLADKSDIPSLTEYVKKTDYAGSTEAGVVRYTSTYNFGVSSQGFPYAYSNTLDQYNNRGGAGFIGKGTLENIKSDLTKRALTDTAQTPYTDEEKQAVKDLIGVVIGGAGVVGLVQTDSNAGLEIASSGYLRGAIRTAEEYRTGSLKQVISKGTLENIIEQKVLQYAQPKEKLFEKLAEVTTVADQNSVIFETDSNGVPLDLSDFSLQIAIPIVANPQVFFACINNFNTISYNIARYNVFGSSQYVSTYILNGKIDHGFVRTESVFVVGSNANTNAVYTSSQGMGRVCASGSEMPIPYPTINFSKISALIYQSGSFPVGTKLTLFGVRR